MKRLKNFIMMWVILSSLGYTNRSYAMSISCMVHVASINYIQSVLSAKIMKSLNYNEDACHKFVDDSAFLEREFTATILSEKLAVLLSMSHSKVGHCACETVY